MKKYYVEITQATKKEERTILQSKWLNSKESARRWANNIEYADDNIHAYIMSAEWDTQEDTYGDIIQEESLIKDGYNHNITPDTTIEDLRKGYRTITGLDNDDELTDTQLLEYMKKAIG